MDTIFFFGSLRDKELLEIVLGRGVSDTDAQEAVAEDHGTFRLETEAYPMLAPSAGSRADGVLVSGLQPADVDRLQYFEEAEYGLSPITVMAHGRRVETVYFRSTDRVRPTAVRWSFADWQRDERPVALEAATELMDHYGIVSLEDSNAIWPGIMIRARMRVRAKASRPATGTLRSRRVPGDVVSESLTRPYTGYFAIEQHRLRHRLFDGQMSAPMERTAVMTGDAVTIVPFDVQTEEVLLIEQFRAAMYARGDACPWAIEAIAGRIDHELDAEACARREAQEEGGLDLGPVEQIAGYYSSPGFAAEHITSFVGSARLAGHGGVFGLDSESENIRAFSVPLDAALDAVATGEINNGPAILSLMWIARNRDRLRAKWS